MNYMANVVFVAETRYVNIVLSSILIRDFQSKINNHSDEEV